MTIEAARLAVYVGADTADAERKLDSFGSRIGSLAGSAAKYGAVMTAGFTAPIAMLAKSAISAAADFESQINIMSVAASDASVSMEDLRQAALNVGADTALVGISASQAADAMTNFYKAGLTTNEIMGDMEGYLAGTAELSGALRSAIDLAAASELDLAAASDLTVIAMSTFGMSADNATDIANSFVRAADASVTNVTELGAAMTNVGSTMAAYGYDLDMVNTALAVLSSRGIRGAEAGTALKSMFTNMQRQTTDVIATWEKLGVSMYDAEGTMRALPDIIGDLERAMAGMTQQQRNQTIQTLAGTYGMKAMHTLLAEGAQGWADMASSIEGAAGSQETAAARTKGFAAAMEQLKGNIETIQITVFDPLLKKFVTPFIQYVTTIIGKIATLDPKILNMALAFAGVLAIAGPLALAFAGLVAIVGALATPFGLIVLAVAAFAAAWAGDFMGIRAKTQEVIDFVAPYFETMRAWLAEKIPEAVEALKLKWDEIWGALAPYVEGVGAAIGTAVANVKTWIAGGGINEALDTLKTKWQEFSAGAQAALAMLEEFLAPTFQRLKDAVQPMLDGLGPLKEKFGDLGTAAGGLLEALKPVAAFITGVLVAAWKLFGDIVAAVMPDAGRIVGNAVDIITALIETLTAIITGVVDTVSALLSGDWAGAWEAAKGMVGGVAEGIGEIARLMADTLLTVFSDIMEGANNWLMDMGVDIAAGWEKIVSEFRRKMEEIVGMLRGKWDEMVRIVGQKMADILAGVRQMLQHVLQAIQGFDLFGAGAALMQGMIDGIVSMAGALASAAMGVVQNAIDAAKRLLGIQSPSRVFAEIGLEMIAGLIQGLSAEEQEAVTRIADIISSIMRAAQDTMNTWAQMLTVELPEADIQPVIDWLTDFARRVGEAFKRLSGQITFGEGFEDFVNRISEALRTISDAAQAWEALRGFKWSSTPVEPVIEWLVSMAGLVAQALQRIRDWDSLADVGPQFAQFVESLRGIFQPLEDAADFVRTLVGLKFPEPGTIPKFVPWLASIAWIVADTVSNLRKWEGMDKIDAKFAEFVDRLKGIFQPLYDAIKLVDDLARLSLPRNVKVPDAIRWLASIAGQVADAVSDLRNWEGAGSWNDALVAFAKRLSEAFTALSAALKFVNELGAWRGATDLQERFGKFRRVWEAIIEEFTRMRRNVGAFVDDDLRRFAAALGEIGQGLTAAISLLTVDLSRITTPAADVWLPLVKWVTDLFNWFAAWVENSPYFDANSSYTTALVAEFSGGLGTLLSALKTAAEVALALPATWQRPGAALWSDFTGWVQEVFQTFYDWVNATGTYAGAKIPFGDDGLKLVTAFGTALSSVMAGLQSALAMITNFSFTAPDPKIWADFEAWVQAVFASFYALINSTGSYAGKPVPFGEDGLKLVTTFGSALSGLMGGLGAAMQVLTGLATYIAPAHSRITSFVTDVKTLMTEAIAQISSQITPEAAKLAGDMGTAIGNLANGLKAALDLFSTLAGTQPGVYTPGTAAGDFENRIGTLMAGIHGTLVAFRTYVQQKFPADWLPAAQTFATAVQQIFSVLSQALNLFRDLATTGMPTAQQLTAFVTAVLDIFKAFAVELSAQATPIQAAGTGINAGLINGLVAKLTGGTGSDTVEGKAKQVAKTLYDSIHNNITSYQMASGYGVSIDQGLIDGMVSKSSSVATTAFSLGAKIDSEIKRALGIASPSQAAMDIAGEVGAGAVLGLRGAMAQVGAAAAALGQAMLPGGGELAFANLPQQRMTVRHEVIVRSPDGSVDAAAMAALADRLGPYLRDGVRMRRY